MLNVVVQLHLIVLFTTEHNKLLTINDKQLNSKRGKWNTQELRHCAVLFPRYRYCIV